MAEAMLLVTMKRAWDIDANILAEPSDVTLFWKRSGIEYGDQEVSVTALTIHERRDARDVGHPISPEIRQHLIPGHVAKFRRKNCAFARVASLMELDTLSAESSDFQQRLCVDARDGLQDQSVIR